MPIMNKFFFYYSVRLGSIISGLSSALQAIISLGILLAMGPDNFRNAVRRMRSYVNEHQQENFLETVLSYIETDATTILWLLVVYFLLYFIICCIEIFGAFKLKKFLLIPYIIEELFLLIILFGVHVFGMMLLRKTVNLGVLIGVTVTGGFGLLFLFYKWACVVALYQIIGIVKTEKYRRLYGDNPLKPIKKSSTTTVPDGEYNLHFNDSYNINNSTVIENVKMYKTPDFNIRNIVPKKKNNVNLNNGEYFLIPPKRNRSKKKSEYDVDSFNMLQSDFNNLQDKLQKFTYNNYKNHY